MARVIIRGPGGKVIKEYKIPNAADKPDAEMDRGQSITPDMAVHPFKTGEIDGQDLAETGKVLKSWR